MYQELQHKRTAIVMQCLLNLLFSDIPVAVAVGVFLSSLLARWKEKKKKMTGYNYKQSCSGGGS